MIDFKATKCKKGFLLFCDRIRSPIDQLVTQTVHSSAFHAPILIAWLADKDSLMCFIVTMGRQIAEMFYTFSL